MGLFSLFSKKKTTNTVTSDTTVSVTTNPYIAVNVDTTAQAAAAENIAGKVLDSLETGLAGVLGGVEQGARDLGSGLTGAGANLAVAGIVGAAILIGTRSK